MKKVAKNHAFKAGLQKGYIRHLFLSRMSEFDEKLDLNIALHHFSPIIIAENSKRRPNQDFITAIDARNARAVGLTVSDRIDESDLFYALPNFSHDSVMSYLADAENEAVLRGSDIQPSPKLSSTSKAALRNIAVAVAAEEKLRLKVIELQVVDDKERATLSESQELLFQRIQQEHDSRIRELESRLSASAISLKAAEDNLISERAASDIIVEKHTQEKKETFHGLQRSAILTDSYHASNSTLCNHLFGFKSFTEYKIYCSIIFPNISLVFGVHQSAITEWEKCTMAIMKSRRRVSNQLLGAI